MAHILIATPTAGGVVKAQYAETLFKATLALRDDGWAVDFIRVDGCYVSIARNHFANVLLRHRSFTHLVMIDSDMSFDGHIILRLLRCGKPFVAAAYAKRRMDMAAFAQAARNPELALADLAALASEYNIQPEIETGTRHIKVIDGMCRVYGVGLGCAAIHRDAFESLIAAGLVGVQPVHPIEGIRLEGPFYDFFGEITTEDGTRLGEDYSFCKRWLSIPDNEIWAVVDEVIGHVGDVVYSAAPYLNRLMLGKR